MRILEVAPQHDLTFRIENIGYSRGQSDRILIAYREREPVGQIEYSDYESEPHVQMIRVPEQFRRQGIGTAMVRHLQAQYPGIEIDMGMTTDDGHALLGSMPQRIIGNPEHERLSARLAQLQQREQSYQAIADRFYASPTPEGREELLRLGDDWNALHDEIYDLEKQLQDIRGPARVYEATNMTEMMISELYRPKDIDAATRVLRRGGYQDITKEPGHTGGSYGEVYWRSDRPYVVKLFMPTDEAYLRYLNLIQRVRSPHFPVLRGKPMRMNERYYAVRLERLTPLPANLDNTRYWMEAVLEYLAAGNVENAKSSAGNLPKSIVHALAMIYLKCVKGIPTMIDMSKYNVMVRSDGTIVIVDPIANP